MSMICNIVCLPKTDDSSSSSRTRRELSTIIPELPQRDKTDPRAAVGPNDACSTFENPNFEKQEFYSPGYPEFYPNHTDCVLVLEAPPGHLINLDFREYFDIEPSPGCTNDYLEVRDGAHGYNKLMRHLFCGRGQFPPMLTSSDRHLWIHFRSDENIEYQGFKAVFEYIPRPTNITIPEKQPCRIDVSGVDQGTLSKEDIDNKTLTDLASKDLPIDCIWVITVKEGWKIQLNFDSFNLDKPYDCDTNFVDIFTDKTVMSSRIRNFCGSVAESIGSEHNILFLRFYAEAKSMKSSFKATFTAYRPIEKPSVCSLDDEFDCEDATCISKALVCNGVNNCRFRWDEDNCDINKKMPLSESHIVIIMVIFSLILSGMCFTFIFNCVKKLIRDHQTIQEYIRESREQQLNELGKQDHMEKKTKVGRSRSNSTQSSDSHKFAANALLNAPCYVPGGELLPILIRSEHNVITANGSDGFNGHHQTVPYPEPDPQQQQQQPEMCDSACQTRESLFATHTYGSEHSTPNHSVTSTNSKPSPPAPFSTFGYKKEAGKYRAEAKIEMEKPRFEDKRRPYSVQTTKSAPDVIVTH